MTALAPLLDQLPDDMPVYSAAQSVLDVVAGFPLHRGILAIGQRIDPPSPERALADAAAMGRDVLLLSAIANHDNMGGIFRNAAGFGVGAVLLDRDGMLERVLYRAAQGEALNGIAAKGASIVVSSLRGGRWSLLEVGSDPVTVLVSDEAVKHSPRFGDGEELYFVGGYGKVYDVW